MIVYDLECRTGAHRFEGWFKSSDDYARQQERALLACPHCGSTAVDKAIQAPRLARKGNQMPQAAPTGRGRASVAAKSDTAAVAGAPLPPQAAELMQALATIQAEALKSSRYVGESFIKDARAMHYGEQEAETIHGQATVAEAKELLEEGIGLMPLPFPVVPLEQAN